MTNDQLLVTLTRMGLDETRPLREREAASLAVKIINRTADIRKELNGWIDELRHEVNRL